MNTIDVRTDAPVNIEAIRFADAYNNIGDHQASLIERAAMSSGQVYIYEGDDGDSIRVNGVQHAKDLIKAVEKAIELGWIA